MHSSSKYADKSRTYQRKKKNDLVVYHLVLEHGCHYVGKTSRPVGVRLDEHRRGEGPCWTRKHAPLRIGKSQKGDGHDETALTHRLMEKYGMDKVRGGPYCRVKLSADQERSILNNITAASDRCYRCHEKGHFSSDCPHHTELIEIFSNFENDWHSDVHWDGFYLSDDEESQFSDTVAFCSRCQRQGHSVELCYASRTVQGGTILDDSFDLRDEDFPLFCSICRRTGHGEDDCYAKTTSGGHPIGSMGPDNYFFGLDDDEFPLFCSKCHRTGHVESNCYAKTTSDGRPIGSSGPTDDLFGLDDDRFPLFCSKCHRAGHVESNCYAKTTSYGRMIGSTNPDMRVILHVDDGPSGVCLRCKRPGHDEGNCYAKTSVAGGPIRHPNPFFSEPVVSRACARCQRSGHSSDDCYAKTTASGMPIMEQQTRRQGYKRKRQESDEVVCSRCQRSGHTSQTCYAKSTAFGEPIVETRRGRAKEEPARPTRERQGRGGTCTRCQRSGHTSGECHAKTTARGRPLTAMSQKSRGREYRTEYDEYEWSDGYDDLQCFRCGRTGHTANRCWARTEIGGEFLY